MADHYLDAKSFDMFVQSESGSSTAGSSKANTNTSHSTAPTPASLSSPAPSSLSFKEDPDAIIPEEDVKPSLSSLDSLLQSKAPPDLSEVASKAKPSVQAIVTLLEDIVRTFIDLINDRMLTPDHPVTASFDPKFSANTPPPWPQGTEDLPAYLKRLISLAAETEYRMVVQGLDTHVYKNGHAGVFVTSDVIGVPPGVVRHVVAIFRFRKRDGAWRCFTVEEVIGIQNTSDGDPIGGFAGPF
ncbi:hypothetical protein CKM354_000857700 [Cercospora kikuchii]|uniref:SnoaL-like domain-containing protein n=1 Tax=Cercospora kikuchii TaxID=84275 RepID=A0A9P3CRQ7_9PEZI|nr:uncharacterized protein CKM354_000857700 [Cercospora kikuchii]GIZ45410.1 hypothetical protein CKM354_000857700 [Cercospora kikuchii]